MFNCFAKSGFVTFLAWRATQFVELPLPDKHAAFLLNNFVVMM